MGEALKYLLQLVEKTHSEDMSTLASADVADETHTCTINSTSSSSSKFMDEEQEVRPEHGSELRRLAALPAPSCSPEPESAAALAPRSPASSTLSSLDTESDEVDFS